MIGIGNATSTTGCNALAQKEGLTSLIDRANSALDMVNESQERLISSLSPLMRPERVSPQSSDKAAPPPDLSPLELQLVSIIQRINMMADFNRYAMDRLPF